MTRRWVPLLLFVACVTIFYFIYYYRDTLHFPWFAAKSDVVDAYRRRHSRVDTRVDKTAAKVASDRACLAILKGLPLDEHRVVDQVSMAKLVEEGRLGVGKDPRAAEEMYVRAANAASQSNDLRGLGDALINLGQLYERSQRVPEAFRTYLDAFRVFRDDAGIRIGNMYAYGMHPVYTPNKAAARHVFSLLSSQAPGVVSIDVADVAALKNVELAAFSGDPDVNAGHEMDLAAVWTLRDILVSRHNEAHEAHEAHVEAPVVSLFQAMIDEDEEAEEEEGGRAGARGRATEIEVPRVRPSQSSQPILGLLRGTRTRDARSTMGHNRAIDDDERLARELGGGLGGIAAQARLFDDARRRLNTIVVRQGADDHGNGQNVHSTTAQNMAVARLEAIAPAPASAPASATVPASSESTFLSRDKEFRDAAALFSSTAPASLSSGAQRVLSTLTSTPHSKYNKSEQQIFVDVMARIHAPENKDRKDDMLAVLASNMASGVERGLVVCSTGKIMRVLGSLDAMDADPVVAEPLKPEWAVNMELAGMAASIRTKAMAAMDAAKLQMFERDGDKGVSEAMQAELTQRTEAEYVAAGILTSADAAIRLKPLLEAL